jgi:hypothetical protein
LLRASPDPLSLTTKPSTNQTGDDSLVDEFPSTGNNFDDGSAHPPASAPPLRQQDTQAPPALRTQRPPPPDDAAVRIGGSNSGSGDDRTPDGHVGKAAGGRGGGAGNDNDPKHLLESISPEHRLTLRFSRLDGFVPAGFARPGLAARAAGRVAHPNRAKAVEERQIMFGLSGERGCLAALLVGCRFFGC